VQPSQGCPAQSQARDLPAFVAAPRSSTVFDRPASVPFHAVRPRPAAPPRRLLRRGDLLQFADRGITIVGSMFTLMDAIPPPPRRRARATRLALPGLCALLAACAASAPQALKESLDEHSTLTVTQLEKPVWLLRTAALGSSADPFVFLGPFETDRMGARALYLWIAVPAIERVIEPPQVFVEQRSVELGALRSAAATGLSRSPYRKPEPWGVEFYYTLDAAQLARLAHGTHIDVVVHYAKLGEQHFEVDAAPAELARFAERIAQP
jgi:hypothetical protein